MNSCGDFKLDHLLYYFKLINQIWCNQLIITSAFLPWLYAHFNISNQVRVTLEYIYIYINHLHGTHAFTHLLNKYTTFIVSRTVYPKFVKIVFTSFSYAPYKLLLSINNILTCASVILLCFFHFHHTLFLWAVGACVNPKSFYSLFVHSLVCQITRLFVDRF